MAETANRSRGAVAECEGLLPPKHDAGTATRHYRAFWQRICRAAAAGAVLKPQGGNCAVLPKAFLTHNPAAFVEIDDIFDFSRYPLRDI